MQSENGKKTNANVAEDQTPVHISVKRLKALKGGYLPQKGIRKPGTKEVAKRELALSGCV